MVPFGVDARFTLPSIAKAGRGASFRRLGVGDAEESQA